MDIKKYYESLTAEIEGLKDRVRNFIDDAHWLTDGEWKESVLKDFLKRSVPDTAKIGRGFIVANNSPSSQIDILIYRHDSPVFFRDGDLVFIPPEGVLGVIEVKSNIKNNLPSLKEILRKLVEIRKLIPQFYRREVIVGLFSYELEIKSNNRQSKNEKVLNALKDVCTSDSEIVDLICLSENNFFKWWDKNPSGESGQYKKWHSYTLEKMAPGYFIYNIILHLNNERYWSNQEIWFPRQSKEFNKDGEIGLEKNE